MDTLTRNLYSIMLPVGMVVLAVLFFREGMYSYTLLLSVGGITVRLVLSTQRYATGIQELVKSESSVAQYISEFVGRHFLRP